MASRSTIARLVDDREAGSYLRDLSRRLDLAASLNDRPSVLTREEPKPGLDHCSSTRTRRRRYSEPPWSEETGRPLWASPWSEERGRPSWVSPA
jgi:hypothetical protein